MKERQVLAFKCSVENITYWLTSSVFIQSQGNDKTTMLGHVLTHKSKEANGVFNHNLEL